MCPVCIATMALIAGSAASTLGVAAVVVTKFQAKKGPNQAAKQSKEESDGQH